MHQLILESYNHEFFTYQNQLYSVNNVFHALIMISESYLRLMDLWR